MKIYSSNKNDQVQLIIYKETILNALYVYEYIIKITNTLKQK